MAVSRVGVDRRQDIQGVITAPDALFFRDRERIAQLAMKQQLPLMFWSRETVISGGLLSYGPSVPDIFRRAATFIDKILKGERVADLPVEQPAKFELILNLKTAKTLGIVLPPALLGRADEVIE